MRTAAQGGPGPLGVPRPLLLWAVRGRQCAIICLPEMEPLLRFWSKEAGGHCQIPAFRGPGATTRWPQRHGGGSVRPRRGNLAQGFNQRGFTAAAHVRPRRLALGGAGFLFLPRPLSLPCSSCSQRNPAPLRGLEGRPPVCCPSSRTGEMRRIQANFVSGSRAVHVNQVPLCKSGDSRFNELR